MPAPPIDPAQSSQPMRVIDGFEGDGKTLATYLGSLRVEALARSWSGLIVSVFVEDGLTVGELALALSVVSKRLHGVVMDPLWATYQRGATVPSSRPLDGDKVTGSGRRQPVMTTSTPAPSNVKERGDGFTVKTGSRPTPTARTARMDTTPLVQAIIKLGPGEHIVVARETMGKGKQPAVWMASRIKCAKQLGGHARLASYEIEGGDRVVYVKPGPEDK